MNNTYNSSLNFIQTSIEMDGIEEGKRLYYDYLEGTRSNPWTDRVMKRSLDRLAPGQVLIRRALEPAAQAIHDWFIDCAQGKAGPGSIVAVFLAPYFEKHADDLMVGAREIAFMTLKTLLASLGENRNACVLAIGNAIKAELELEIFRQWKDPETARDMEGLFFHCLNKFKAQTGNTSHRYKAMKDMRAKKKIPTAASLGWTRGSAGTVGTRLFNIVAGLTGWVMQIEEKDGVIYSKGKRISKSSVVLHATPEFLEVIEQAHATTAIQEPIFPPMVVPPRDWTDPFTGAYLTEELSRKVPLIKTNNPILLQELAARGDDLKAVYEAINQLQRTGYRINQGVLSVVHQLFEAGIEVDGLPSTKKAVIPPRPCEKEEVEHFKQTRPEDWKKWLKEAKEAYEYNNAPRRASDLIEIQRVLSVADNFKTYDALYFPMQLDFRGRGYYVPNYLHPQGSDMVKGLLELAEGKPVGDAEKWLAVAGANAFAVKSKKDAWLLARTNDPERSLDKCSFVVRYDWVLHNEANILAAAANPTEFLWWTQADAPFQFLAFCLDWAGYRNAGPDHVSHLIVYMDGACNGIQHWASLMRCEVTAPKVCLTPTEEPGDIYSDVAEAVRQIIREDMLSEDGETRALASFWLPKIDRSLVKRAVMTAPYGLTSYGMRQQYRKMLKDQDKGDLDFKAATKEFQKAALTYLQYATDKAMQVAVSSAAIGMDWLKIVADYLAADGIPINWTTPDGLPVWQGYPETTSVKIKTYINGDFVAKSKSWEVKETIDEATGEIRTAMDISGLTQSVETKGRGAAMIITMKEPVPGKLSRAKNKNSIAPNVVHSLDGTAMRMMVLKAAALGVTSVSTVHDSFGTHAADYERLAKATREAFVECHQGDYLALWFSQVTSAMEDTRLDELKAVLTKKFGGIVPQKGALDLSVVLQSDYFFA